MSRLKQVLKEEINRILEGASDRPDRMIPFDADEDRGTRWYESIEDFSREDETLEEAMYRIMAEEYRRYRDTSDQDVEDKLGIFEFEVEEREDRDRWFEPEDYGKEKIDKSTIEEVAKRALKNLINER